MAGCQYHTEEGTHYSHEELIWMLCDQECNTRITLPRQLTWHILTHNSQSVAA